MIEVRLPWAMFRRIAFLEGGRAAEGWSPSSCPLIALLFRACSPCQDSGGDGGRYQHVMARLPGQKVFAEEKQGLAL